MNCYYIKFELCQVVKVFVGRGPQNVGFDLQLGCGPQVAQMLRLRTIKDMSHFVSCSQFQEFLLFRYDLAFLVQLTLL